jgi:hypothetical protein
VVTRLAAAGKTPALRRVDLFLPAARGADFLLVIFFVEDFLLAAPVARRRPPAFRAVDRFRLGERLRPRVAEVRPLRDRAAPFLPLLELRRDDFLAAAMIQLRGKNVPTDDSARLYSNFRAQRLR